MSDRPRGQRYAAIAAVLALAAAAPAQCSATGHGAPGHPREHRYAQRIFGGAELGCLAQLWDRESGWDPYAVNPGSGAYGIPQALPSVHGHPYALGDWKAQIRWGRRYIVRRYGGPCAALAHEDAKGWY